MLDQPITHEDTAALATLLREGRNAKDWTLRQAAGHTGVSNGYLSLMENGEVKAPSPRYLLSIASHYGLSFDRLMELAGHPSGPVPAIETGRSTHAGAVRPTRRRATGGPFRSVHLVELDPAETPEHTDPNDPLGEDGASTARNPSAASSASARLGRAGAMPDAGKGGGANQDWEILVQLVAEDLAGLSTGDIAQVRAFIAGMRAARR